MVRIADDEGNEPNDHQCPAQIHGDHQRPAVISVGDGATEERYQDPGKASEDGDGCYGDRIRRHSHGKQW